MDRRICLAFAFVVAAQAAHSLEESVFGLFEVFGPARAVSELFGRDPATGFAIANLAIVAAGVVCYLAIVRPGRHSARPVAWFWALLELANGVGHGVLALSEGGYFPGVATAPLLVLTASLLGFRLLPAWRPGEGGPSASPGPPVG